MTDSTTHENGSWCTWDNWLKAIGLLFLLGGFLLEVINIAEIVWKATIAGALLLLLGNLGKLDEFSLGLTSGIKAKMRKAIKEAQDSAEEARATIDQLRQIAVPLAKAAMVQIYRGDRLGESYSDESREQAKDELLQVLNDINVPEKDVAQILEIAHMMHCRDYIGLWTKLIDEQHREIFNKEFKEQLEAAWPDGPSPTPEDLEKIVNQAGPQNAKAAEVLEDYRYYMKHREHRRPDIWRHRHDLQVHGRLDSNGELIR
jgi:hypothetical protein